MSAEGFRRELHAAAALGQVRIARIRPMPLPLDFPPPPGQPWHLKAERIEVAR
jgi:hypothetical protein